MLRMLYTSENGTMEWTGQAGRNRIEAMTGFDLLTKSYSSIDLGPAGTRTEEGAPQPRAMTVKFELYHGGDLYSLQQKKARMMHVLYRPGRLSLQRFHTKRCIDVQQVTVEPGDRNELWQDFVVQFTADSPFFHDEADREVPVYREEDHLSGAFQLPMVFTSRYNDCDVLVEGHEAVQPVFRLHGGEGAQGGSAGVRITNQTTGGTVLIHHAPQAGEVVTVDVAQGDLLSTLDGDIIASLDLDSYLSELRLRPGHNRLVVENYCTDDAFTAFCVFNNNYVEGCV